jgi:hypothetical protein
MLRRLTKVDPSFPMRIIIIPPFAMIERIGARDIKVEMPLTGLSLTVTSLYLRRDACIHSLFS